MSKNRHGGRRKGAGRPPGTPNPNGGRPPASLRGLDISAIGVEFDRPVRYRADSVAIEKCGSCGCVWWDPFTVWVTTAEEQPEPDEGGRYFHLLATVEVAGQEERHLKSCDLIHPDALSTFLAMGQEPPEEYE